MKFTQQLTDDDYREFFVLFYSRSRQYKSLLFTGLFFAFVAIVSPLISSSRPFPLWILSFLCLFVSYGIFTGRRNFIKSSLELAKQEKFFGKTQEIEIEDGKFYLNAPGIKEELNLNVFIGYHSGGKVFMLYLAGNKAYFLRKDAFKGEASENQLVSLLEGVGVKPMYV